MAKPISNRMGGDFFSSTLNLQDFGSPNPPADATPIRKVTPPVLPERVLYGYDPVPVATPQDVGKYLQQTYSPDELREGYSDLRTAVLFGKTKLYKFTDRPRPPEYEAENTVQIKPGQEYRFTVGSGGSGEPVHNLTDRANSAILEDADQPEEQHMLSREEAEAVFKRGAAALAEIDRLEAKYSPDLPDGSVISFKLNFAPAHAGAPAYYHYAAIRAAGHWFTTGKISQAGADPSVGIDWILLLEAFEKLNGDDFEILRTGGIGLELESSERLQEPTKTVKVPLGHTVVIPPDQVEDLTGASSDDYDDNDDYTDDDDE
jgi:hypothetical protein